MSTGTTGEYYDNVWASVYGGMQADGPVHRHMRRKVHRLLQCINYSSVLDIGCGQGHSLPLLCQGHKVTRLTGVDVSPSALEIARQHSPGEFYELDIQTSRLNAQWDLVHCSLLLEHLPDDLAALANMRAMTGKHLLLTTIAGNFERYKAWDARMGHVRNYRRGELEAKLQQCGFRVRCAIYWGFPLYSPLVRLLQNRSDLGTGKYGWPTRLAAWAIYYLYYLNSARKGDLLIVLAGV
jgi:SAM-dependent methyltransferase